MTREIKYRAWEYSHKTKKWSMNYSPSIYDCESLGEFSMVDLNCAFSNYGDADNKKGCVRKDLDGNIIDREKTGTIFMQYTGLKDKHGKEIYEGDIIIQEHWSGGNDYSEPDETDKFKGIVIYETSGFGIQTSICKKGETEVPLFENNQFLKSEVIGNIYEHKHLLDNTDTKS